MKDFEHLDNVLQFLRDRDEGSFSYYRDEPNSIDLINYLDSIGVAEIDRLKLLLHLAYDGYIEIYPDPTKLHGQFPEQLKINLKGKLFIINGGYEKENIKKVDTEKRFWIPIIISGLSILLALVSLVISYKTDKPDISILNDRLMSAIFRDSSGTKKHFGLLRGTIRNNGKRAITLLGIRPHEYVDIIMASQYGSDKVEKISIPYKVFQIPDTILPNQLFAKESNLSKFKNQGIERLSYLNQIIEPGSVLTLNIGTVMDLFSDSTKKYHIIFFSTQLEFSDGTKINFGASDEVKTY